MNTVSPEPINSILARYPGQEPQPELWHRPGEGVFLAYSGQTGRYRICSKADFDKNHSILIQQGWILAPAREEGFNEVYSGRTAGTQFASIRA